MTVHDAYSFESKVRKLHQAMEMSVWPHEFAADMFSGIWPERAEVIEGFTYCFLPGCWSDASARDEGCIKDARWINRMHADSAVRAGEVGKLSPEEWIKWWTKTQGRKPEWLQYRPTKVKPSAAEWWQKSITPDLVLEVARMVTPARRGPTQGKRPMTGIAGRVAKRISGPGKKKIGAKRVGDYLNDHGMAVDWIEKEIGKIRHAENK